ncbi:MAG TPA: pyridoxamine 5'-phosphate oxidase family protein [Blastococcus sp.]|jgi:nitroimidazol reductase NimA-like FMN-containing flavoprotein (pyridoxamine 5'-phosphate oxidase superfamily)|nr:pyridoxamine 5'-phosphate oxidase family protein [Blastococcus sp.]
MTSDAGSLDVIPADECFALLGTQEVGRLAVVDRDRPLIVPVNYGLDGRTIVLRTHPGTVLSAAIGRSVAFEVDEVDRRERRGWSVLVVGFTEELGAQERTGVLERTHGSGVEPWAPGEHGVWLRVTPNVISGRRIVPGRLPWGVDDRAYL